jgi:hypothetical protein
MALHETKKLLYNKRNGHQIEDNAQRMRENLCQLYIWQGINNQNIQGVQKTKLLQKYQWSSEEMGK